MHPVIVAFVRSVDEIEKYWPEAYAIDVMEENVPVRFSDRFSEPGWWKNRLDKTESS